MPPEAAQTSIAAELTSEPLIQLIFRIDQMSDAALLLGGFPEAAVRGLVGPPPPQATEEPEDPELALVRSSPHFVLWK